MYFGHYAVAVAVKAKEPDVPVAPLLIGTGLLDILNGAFIMGGLDKVTPNLNASPYLFFDLTFIDWDHSLLMAIFWTALYGLACWLLYKKNTKIGIISAMVAFLHFVADLPMHNADMAIYPMNTTKPCIRCAAGSGNVAIAFIGENHGDNCIMRRHISTICIQMFSPLSLCFFHAYVSNIAVNNISITHDQTPRVPQSPKPIFVAE